MSDQNPDRQAALDALRDALHDETDEKEEFDDRAAEIVARIRERIIDLVDEYGDTVKALEASAIIVEDELDPLTTEAVKAGYKAGARRPV